MSEELKPCPFCGSTDVGVFQHVGDEGTEELYHGSCWDCSANADWESTPDKAIERWNTRPSLWHPINGPEDLPKEEGAYVWWLRLGSSRIVQYFLPNALTNAKFVREYAAYWSQPIEPYKEPTND